MNLGRGWNPDLEESYLHEYSEYEAATFTQDTSGIYIWPVIVLAHDPSPISRYSECTKMTSFSLLGFFKLGFDFPGVLPNQKLRSWSLKFDFDEERNPMPGSLKNYSSARSPNFPQGKLKMLGIEFCFDIKMRPSMESHPSILLPMDC